MLPNGKAELAAQRDHKDKSRYERLEIYGLMGGLVVGIVLSCLLYNSMEDGWQQQPETRPYVLTYSVSLFLWSVVFCVYLCLRTQPNMHSHSPYLSTLTSVNSEICLVREQPPSYETITTSDQSPPPYNVVFTV